MGVSIISISLMKLIEISIIRLINQILKKIKIHFLIYVSLFYIFSFHNNNSNFINN